jgi:hypothetical protein
MPSVPAAAHEPPSERASDFRSFWLLAGLMLLAKLLLVAGNEIVAEGHDAWSYVFAASMNPVSDIGGKLPGYPTWLWLWKEAGIPQRLAIEGFFVFSAGVLAWSLRRSVLGPLAAASLLLVTVFSPVSYFLFDRALSDGFYLCLRGARRGAFHRFPRAARGTAVGDIRRAGVGVGAAGPHSAGSAPRRRHVARAVGGHDALPNEIR